MFLRTAGMGADNIRDKVEFLSPVFNILPAVIYKILEQLMRFLVHQFKDIITAVFRSDFQSARRMLFGDSLK